MNRNAGVQGGSIPNSISEFDSIFVLARARVTVRVRNLEWIILYYDHAKFKFDYFRWNVILMTKMYLPLKSEIGEKEEDRV